MKRSESSRGKRMHGRGRYKKLERRVCGNEVLFRYQTANNTNIIEIGLVADLLWRRKHLECLVSWITELRYLVSPLGLGTLAHQLLNETHT